MARTAKYFKSLEKLSHEWGLDLRPQITEQGLRLFGCEFMLEPSYLKEKNEKQKLNIGLLLPSSQTDRKRKYLSDGVSFIDDKGEIFCAHLERALHIKSEGLLPKRVKRPISAVPELRNARPYFLMSPNALAIAETLMRLPAPQLKDFRSGLKFCQRFNLYQPKFSEIARRLNAYDVEELAKKIKNIRIDDWLEAFEVTAARRFMTPFYVKAEPFYSLLPDDSSEDLQDIFEKFKQQVMPGPSEVAKKMGVLIEHNLNLWVSSEATNHLKKFKRLVPGQSKDHRTWLIAVVERGFDKEGIRTHAPQDMLRPGDPMQNNILRSAWDLTFSDTRTREVRKFLLRRLLNEI